MIDINKLLAKHSSNYKYALEVNRQNNSLISGKDIKPFLKEYTELLLKEAANKAETKCLNMSSFGSTNKSSCSECEYHIINKESITSIINDIKFD